MPIDREDVEGRLELVWSSISASFEEGFKNGLALRKLLTVVTVDEATPAIDPGEPDTACAVKWASEAKVVVQQSAARPMWTFARTRVVSRDELGDLLRGGGASVEKDVAELGSTVAGAERRLVMRGLGQAGGMLAMAHALPDCPEAGERIPSRARVAAQILAAAEDSRGPYQLLMPIDDLTKTDRDELPDMVKEVVVVPELDGPLLVGSLGSVKLHIAKAARIVVTSIDKSSATLEASIRESFSIRGSTLPICKLY